MIHSSHLGLRSFEFKLEVEKFVNRRVGLVVARNAGSICGWSSTSAEALTCWCDRDRVAQSSDVFNRARIGHVFIRLESFLLLGNGVLLFGELGKELVHGVCLVVIVECRWVLMIHLHLLQPLAVCSRMREGVIAETDLWSLVAKLGGREGCSALLKGSRRVLYFK